MLRKVFAFRLNPDFGQVNGQSIDSMTYVMGKCFACGCLVEVTTRLTVGQWQKVIENGLSLPFGF